MSMINLTKKYVDILVNGNQEASYSQHDTNGNYNVSVSDNSTIENGLLQMSTRFNKSHETPTGVSWSFTVSNDGLNGIDTLVFEVDGAYINNTDVTVNGTTYSTGSHSVSLTEGDSIDVSVDTNDPNSNRTAIICARVMLYGDYNTSTGFFVNGVKQTTSN